MVKNYQIDNLLLANQSKTETREITKGIVRFPNVCTIIENEVETSDN